MSQRGLLYGIQHDLMECLKHANEERHGHNNHPRPRLRSHEAVNVSSHGDRLQRKK